MRLRRQRSPLLQPSLHFSWMLACSAPSASFQDDGASLETGSDLSASDAGDPGGAAEPSDHATPIDAAVAPEGSEPLQLRFVARVGAAPFACGRTYQMPGVDDFTPADLRLFVQDVALIDAAGNERSVQLDVRAPWQLDGVALLDFEDASAGCLAGTREQNFEITGRVPAGDYRGITFSNGVPEGLNHADPSRLPPPLQAGSMSWGWLQGYRFLMAEVTSVAGPGDAAAPGSALLHLGSTACSGNPSAGGVVCSKVNRNRVRLPTFDADTDVVVIDLAELFAGMDLGAVTTCHSSGDDCAPLFDRIGLDLASGAPTDGQRIYRVEPASATDP